MPMVPTKNGCPAWPAVTRANLTVSLGIDIPTTCAPPPPPGESATRALRRAQERACRHELVARGVGLQRVVALHEREHERCAGSGRKIDEATGPLHVGLPPAR